MVFVNSIMASLHHIAAFTVAACLVYEFVAYRQNLTVAEARNIQRVDLAYGIAAGVVWSLAFYECTFSKKALSIILPTTSFGQRSYCS